MAIVKCVSMKCVRASVQMCVCCKVGFNVCPNPVCVSCYVFNTHVRVSCYVFNTHVCVPRYVFDTHVCVYIVRLTHKVVLHVVSYFLGAANKHEGTNGRCRS